MRTSAFLLLTVPAACTIGGMRLSAADNLSDPIIRVSAAAWYQKPAVTIEPNGGGKISGDSVGLEDSHVGLMADAYLDLPVPLIPGIHAGAWNWKETPNAGGDVSVTGGYAAAMWELELIDRVGVAFGGGALGEDIDPGNGNRERFIVPAAAARGWFRFTDGLSVEARLMYGAWTDARAFDGVAQLNWRFLGPVAAIGGWRQVNSALTLSNRDQWGVALGGPFLGASASF